MNNVDIICAIASGQPDPIIIPFLSKENSCKHLVLFVSTKIKNEGQANNIAYVLKSRGIFVELIDISEEPTWENLQDAIEQTRTKYADKIIAFNANGGTKPMIIAAYEKCYIDEIPVFYVNDNQIIWLYQPNNMSLETETIKETLNVNQYFSSHGYDLVEQKNSPTTVEINNLIDNWSERDNANEIGALNFLAKEAENTLKTKIDYQKLGKNNGVTDLLLELEDCQLVDYSSKDTLRFVSEEARFFCNGGWYEQYLTRLLRQINKEKFDGRGRVLSSVTFRSKLMTEKAKNTKNEFDVVYILDNRLFAFECKTADLTRESSKYENLNRVDDAVYKLGSMLYDLGGLSAKGVIVSYRPVNELDKQRAKLLGIDIIEHKTQKNLLIDKLVNIIRNSSRRI